MDGGASGGAGKGGGGSPAPFLLKTYEMVDDSSTDAIVSWSHSRKSFVVWNPPEFASVLLPSNFKHNNFSSFIRQLNTYGFRKIDPEKWEFANEDFVKDQKHLLKNIHRRKPIHSHSQPQGSVDPDRAAFEEEIDKLTCERSVLEENVLAFENQQSAAKAQLENLTQRIGTMEQRQERLLSFLEKSIQNPEFVERLVQKLVSMDFSAYNKKRRLPQADHVQSTHENIFVDNQSSSRSDSGNIGHEDLCNKLRLELSPTVSNANLLSHSTQSSNDDGVSPQGRMDGCSKDTPVRTAGFYSPPETVELSDTGASFSLNTSSSLSFKAGPKTPNLHSLHETLPSNDEGDGHVSCLLNLTLSSSHLEHNKSQNTIGASVTNDSDVDGAAQKDGIHSEDARLSSSSLDVGNDKQGHANTQNQQVNDVFWEQFLTERPGCSDNEEAISSSRANHFDEHDERKSLNGVAIYTKGGNFVDLFSNPNPMIKLCGYGNLGVEIRTGFGVLPI